MIYASVKYKLSLSKECLLEKNPDWIWRHLATEILVISCSFSQQLVNLTAAIFLSSFLFIFSIFQLWVPISVFFHNKENFSGLLFVFGNKFIF